MRQAMRNRRIQLGLSQQKAAEKAKMTRGNYAHIERGRHEPSIAQMELISKALGLEQVNINFFENNCDEMYRKLDRRIGTDRRSRDMPVKVERRVKGRRTG